MLCMPPRKLAGWQGVDSRLRIHPTQARSFGVPHLGESDRSPSDTTAAMLVRARRFGQAILASAEDALKRPIRATLSLLTTVRYLALSRQWPMYEHPVEACLHTDQCVRIRVRAGWEAPAVAKEATAG